MVKKLSFLNDVSGPLSLRQLSFKKALVESTAALQVDLGHLRSSKLEQDFIMWVVRQVEARVDLSMDNRPLPMEVDWRYWLSNLSRLAVHSGIHASTSKWLLLS